MGESLAKSKTDGDPAPEPRANNTGLDPHVLAVMLLFFNLQRTAALQLKLLSRDRRLSERGLLILALVNAGHDQPAKLLKIMDILPSTVTFETDKLVSSGLIKRESMSGDRRMVRLSLTPEGSKLNFETSDLLNALLGPRIAKLAPGELNRFLSIGAVIAPPDR